MRWDENLEGPAKLIVESDDPLICVQAGPGKVTFNKTKSHAFIARGGGARGHNQYQSAAIKIDCVQHYRIKLHHKTKLKNICCFCFNYKHLSDRFMRQIPLYNNSLQKAIMSSRSFLRAESVMSIAG